MNKVKNMTQEQWKLCEEIVIQEGRIATYEDIIDRTSLVDVKDSYRKKLKSAIKLRSKYMKQLNDSLEEV